MNRIDSMFAELKKQNKKALITFITAGDPDFDTTEQLVLEMEPRPIPIELGVPFSDPIAEGPIIQEASLRSLQGGTTLEGIFELVKKLRTKTEIPLVFMMYINTIYRFGVERFFSLCQETGIDAVIVPDLPFEEHDEIDECAYAHGVYPINLVAPTLQDRIAAIAANSRIFALCILTGVTGV
ncbi:MAG: tryptophan synthase subunit alpha [Acutalibacteraceae bacterium]